MIFRVTVHYALAVALLLPLGCAERKNTQSQLEQFWLGRPTNENPLVLAGYERTYAMSASPTVIDEMIADLRHYPSDPRFETYALIAYYMSRPETTDHLAELRQTRNADDRRLADRFAERIADFDAEAAKHGSKIQR